MVYQTEEVMEDLKDKLSAEDKNTLDAALNKLKDALEGHRHPGHQDRH